MSDVDENPYKFPLISAESSRSHSPVQLRYFTRQRVMFWGVSLFVIAVVIGMLIPARRGVSGAARRTDCVNKMRQLGLALHAYANHHGSLPPAYTTDEHGNPLHSWRVLILPYIEQMELYKSIDLTKPWDDPVNAPARQRAPVEFFCRSSQCPPGHTTYLANAWAEGALLPGQHKSLTDFSDSTRDTIMIFEVTAEQSVEWMSPHDGDCQTFLSTMASIPKPHNRLANVVFADGSAKSVSPDNFQSADEIQALFTSSAGD